MHVNLFYMAIGPVSSFLAWLDIKNASILDLLGQISCATLVPIMTYPLLNRMYNDINKDLRTEQRDWHKSAAAGRGGP